MADQPGAGHRAAGRALRNTGTRAAAEVVGKLATFLLFAVLAREVGQEGLGAFVFAFAFLGLGMTPIALGCDSYMLREVARDRSRADRLFFNVIALKLAMAVPVLAALFGALLALGYDDRVRDTVLVLSVGLLLDLLGKSLNGLFNANERSDLLALSLVVQRVATAALGIAALALGYGVVAVAAVYSVGSALGYAVAIRSLRRNIGIPSRTVEPRGWRRLIGDELSVRHPGRVHGDAVSPGCRDPLADGQRGGRGPLWRRLPGAGGHDVHRLGDKRRVRGHVRLSRARQRPAPRRGLRALDQAGAGPDGARVGGARNPGGADRAPGLRPGLRRRGRAAAAAWPGGPWPVHRHALLVADRHAPLAGHDGAHHGPDGGHQRGAERGPHPVAR